jgi:hypothetical protein
VGVWVDPDFAEDRYVQLRGRAWHVWLRRGLLALIAALLVAALLNVFGQRTTSSAVATPEARMEVDAPPRLSGGLLYQIRFRLQPLRHAVSHPKLVLNENWFDGMTLNSFTPNPAVENSRGGRFALAFPALGKGRTLTVLGELQVNPTSLGKRSLSAAFVDGATRLAVVHRTLTIFP